MERRWGLGVEVGHCTGCYTCITACKMENGIPLGAFINRVEKAGPVGRFPKVEMRYLFKTCMQCLHPPCLQACPTAALQKRADGIVVVEAEQCNGCQECLEACPYQALAYLEEKNVAAKCDFCAHRLDRGMDPKCVGTCPTGVLIFGDLNNPESPLSQRLTQGDNFVSQPGCGTAPAVSYLTASRLAREQLGG
ncbi:MAG: 4Fe-4S dicluster domain-containing protein [Candidatus Binatia bacterium]